MARFDGNGNERFDRQDKKNLPALPDAVGIVEPRCKICNSAHRRDIDRYLVMGMSHREIVRYFEALGEDFTPNNISIHSRKHLNLQSAAIRRVIEKRAGEALIDIEETSDFLLTKRSVLEVMLHKGYESILAGMSIVEPRDIITVVEKLEKMEAEANSIAVDEMIRDFEAFADAVRQFVPEDIWPKMLETYKQNLQKDNVGSSLGIEPPLEDVEIEEE